MMNMDPEEAMIRLALAAIFIHARISSGRYGYQIIAVKPEVKEALELADELIKQIKP